MVIRCVVQCIICQPTWSPHGCPCLCCPAPPPTLLPCRELGFEGVPHRETVQVLPTVNCLVELTQMPFTVISLSDIEIINLERVGFNLKNFDMAIVFKASGGRRPGAQQPCTRV